MHSGKKLGILKSSLSDSKIIFLCKGGYEENFSLVKFFWLSSQILDFTLWTKITVVEFSKGKIDRIFPRSVLSPFYVYVSSCMLQIEVLIHEGSTLPLPNRVDLKGSSILLCFRFSIALWVGMYSGILEQLKEKNISLY